MTRDAHSTNNVHPDADDRSTVTDTDSTATEAASEPENERITRSRKALKRTAPSGGAQQGEAKRKDTKKKNENKEAKDAVKAEKVPLSGTNSNNLTTDAAILTTMSTTNTSQNASGAQDSNAAQQDLTTQQQFAEVLSAATNLANQISGPIAVAPLLSAQATGLVANGAAGMQANMEEFLNHPAVAAVAAAQVRQQQQQQLHTTQETTQPTSGSKRNTTLRGMSNEERRQRRLLRNRVAAKECRKKKKAYVADLEEKVTHLEEENMRLRKDLEEMNTKLTLGTLRTDENNRLLKEVEELNAKLAMRAVVQQVIDSVEIPSPKGDSSKQELTVESNS